jgi:hypothetical protein
MIPTSDICPGHMILHLFAKTVNHNLLISLNSFSVRLSEANKGNPGRFG